MSRVCGSATPLARRAELGPRLPPAFALPVNSNGGEFAFCCQRIKSWTTLADVCKSFGLEFAVTAWLLLDFMAG